MQGGAASPSEAGLFWTRSTHLPLVFFGLSLSGKVQRRAVLDVRPVQFHRSKLEAKQSRASRWTSLTHALLSYSVFNGDVGGLDLNAASAMNGAVLTVKVTVNDGEKRGRDFHLIAVVVKKKKRNLKPHCNRDNSCNAAAPLSSPAGTDSRKCQDKTRY